MPYYLIKKACEEGNLDEISDKKKIRKANRKSKKFDDSLNDDDDPNDESLTNNNEDSPNNPDSKGSKQKRKRGRPSATHVRKSLSAANHPALTEKQQSKLAAKMKFLIKFVLQYQDSDGRVLSEPFLQLPTRRELPDYYEIIKKPIDLKRIQQRIKDHKYGSLDELHADFDLMCRNTQEYNIEGSLIYEDSVVLHSVFKTLRARLESESAAAGADGESSDESDENEAKASKNKRARLEKSAAAAEGKASNKKAATSSKSGKQRREDNEDQEEDQEEEDDQHEEEEEDADEGNEENEAAEEEEEEDDDDEENVEINFEMNEDEDEANVISSKNRKKSKDVNGKEQAWVRMKAFFFIIFSFKAASVLITQ